MIRKLSIHEVAEAIESLPLNVQAHRIGDGRSPQTAPVCPRHVSPQRGVITEERVRIDRGHRPRSTPMQARRASEGILAPTLQATRIPLLALRAWMGWRH
jgi:hypothetical protein